MKKIKKIVGYSMLGLLILAKPIIWVVKGEVTIIEGIVIVVLALLLTAFFCKMVEWTIE